MCEIILLLRFVHRFGLFGLGDKGLLGHRESVTYASFPEYVEAYTIENTVEYPVSFNGKMRFKVTLPKDLPAEEVEKTILAHESTAKYLGGAKVRKVIVVPSKIINIVF